jgi:hypothetical protein
LTIVLSIAGSSAPDGSLRQRSTWVDPGPWHRSQSTPMGGPSARGAEA